MTTDYLLGLILNELQEIRKLLEPKEDLPTIGYRINLDGDVIAEKKLTNKTINTDKNVIGKEKVI